MFTDPRLKDIQSISLMLRNELRQVQLIFDYPVMVKAGPHVLIAKYMAVAASEDLRLWVRNNTGNWNEVTANLIYLDHIVGSLRQRLKLMIYRPVMIAHHETLLKTTIVQSI